MAEIGSREMSVFLTGSGWYSQWGVDGVFSTLDKAIEHLRTTYSRSATDLSIDERTVDGDRSVLHEIDPVTWTVAKTTVY